MSTRNIRNFCIIAHIDHGKSTLADRILQITKTVPEREMREQFLDKLDLERERGITIKLQAVRMQYQVDQESSITNHQLPNNFQNSNIKYQNRKQTKDKVLGNKSILNTKYLILNTNNYILNLIDTPGHIDFAYEVNRSLAACEGAILLVDASQGIQAQTLANYQKAKEANLKIIPVVNKIDLPAARQAEVVFDLVQTFGFSEDEILFTSAKTGAGVQNLLTAIVERIPAPEENLDRPLRALVFDSFYDQHKGVIAIVRVVDGKIEKTQLKLINTNQVFEPLEIGYITANYEVSETLETGEVGYIATGLKDISKVRVGETITLADLRPRTVLDQAENRSREQGEEVIPLPGYKEPKPMVIANLFPTKNDQFNQLRDAVEKYNLTDAAFTFKPINSPVLGAGFQCGFLGLLHLDVVRERIETEFSIPTQITTPNVLYQATLKNNQQISVQSPQDLPEPNQINEIKEPWCKVKIFTPHQYIGALMKISEQHRGQYADLKYFGVHAQRDGQKPSEEITARARLEYLMPLAEVIRNFFDQVKSVSSGYASLDYEVVDYRPVDLIKLDILLNKQKHETLSRLVIREQAQEIGQNLVKKLKEVLPKQQFKVPIQAVIGGKVIARENLPALRKDVIAKLYGGDRTRKDKLLKKQAAGKKKLQEQGKLHIPNNVYQKIISI